MKVIDTRAEEAETADEGAHIYLLINAIDTKKEEEQKKLKPQ